jgi:hypothetical protein
MLKNVSMDRFGELLTGRSHGMSNQFHIPPDWPVLPVGDTEDRISWFRKRMPKAVFAKNAESALRALEQREFKVLFLDHDLHWMHADNSIFKGTGKEVARFIAKKNFQTIVIIHSKHEAGAASMKKYFSNARLAPFGSFEINAESR